MTAAEHTRKNLLGRLNGRPVVIWGARMTGMGFARFLAASGEPPALGFIDSDPGLQGAEINGLPVRAPSALQALRRENPGLLVVVSVALKAGEIMAGLRAGGLSETDMLDYAAYCHDFYTIDVVGTCNLKCLSCAHGTPGMASPLGTMKFARFEQVVEKALRETEVVSHVSLYSWGEPLLHPDLGKMVGLLHRRGIAVAVSSNLSIKSETAIRRLAEAAPDYLKVSLSGYYPEAYNLTHAGGDINLVKSNLYRLRYWFDKHRASTLVDVNYHLYNNNCGRNLERMRELCTELGFQLSTTYALVMPLERVIDHCAGKSPEDLQRLRKMLLVDIDEGIAASAGPAVDGCPFRENQININWDLSVPVCCTVYNRSVATQVAQNYLETPLEEINRAKASVKLCGKCMALGLPAYNMGYNRGLWDAIAAGKTCLD